MIGKIIKGIAGFYYVNVPGRGLYECKAKGGFRNQKIKPLVGDDCEIQVLDEDKKTGNMTDIIDRRNSLIRPAVANIDLCMIVFAAAKPQPNLNLLDRFLLQMNRQRVRTVICFNKRDLVDCERMEELRQIYALAGYETIFTSTKTGEGINEVLTVLEGKTTVLAGPSGVGKSSLMNAIYPDACMETGKISRKIERGKHTTRHAELIHVGTETYLMDTPGFSSLYINDFEAGEIKEYFPEFIQYEPLCRFAGCMHLKEPDCGIKNALQEGKISTSRYENYQQMVQEILEKRKW